MSENNKSVKVIGIDPAPSNDSYIFDPSGVLNWTAGRKNPCKSKSDSRVIRATPYQLLSAVKKLARKQDEKVLICWDAPLTGYVWDEVQKITQGRLYTRPIEKKYQDENLPNGINTLGFAAAPHWTISQLALEYPRMMSDDKYKTSPPIKLLTKNKNRSLEYFSSPKVVEVHPAVAMYYWLKEESFTDDGDNTFQGDQISWKYKPKSKSEKNKEYRVTPKDCFKKLEHRFTVLKELDLKEPLKVAPGYSRDGPLDAIVAWLLGRLWLDTEEVTLDGDREGGAWLLPKSAVTD
ncbi:hypothetical protein [Neolewinella antarctica]|uniref:DUF429 domain-containing protein n=1 Tax=Neolewinella antarctica TaxID=442734 RepID=A0ABX0XCP0_9BACT|nr:hypothetical protein [Neolewinella antarctica]NJC27030.1 hypothetical protein [Neolewinella antarctica]